LLRLQGIRFARQRYVPYLDGCVFTQPRPKGARGNFLAEGPVHFGNLRSPNSLRKLKLYDSGRSQVATSDQDKIAVHPKAANWKSRPLVVIHRRRDSMTGYPAKQSAATTTHGQ